MNAHTESVTARPWLRSIGALLVGFILVAILHLGADAVMHATGIFPPWGQPMSDGLFMLATVYRTIFSVVGSYLTARLAPYSPVGHALAGGAIGVMLSAAGAIATRNRGPEFGPHWYPVALILLALPTAWIGGKIRERELVARDQSPHINQ